MVKLACKTVSGASFDVHVPDAEAKISAVKGLIAAAKEDLKDKTLVLIYQGKVLADDTTLAAAGYAETGFMVVMAKPAPKAAAAVPTPAAPTKAPPAATPLPGGAPGSGPSAEGAATPAAPAEAAPAAAPAPAPAAAAATTAAGGGGGGGFEAGASALVTGSALESAVSSICEMGFDRADVQKAMRAAFNNPERAVEYLMTGIPDGLGGGGGGGGGGGEGGGAAAPAAGAAAPAAAAPAAAAPAGPNAQPLDMFAPPPPPGAAGGGGGGGAAAGGAGGGPLDFLRSHPQFRALRGVVQANPGVLQPMLAELGRQNPDLLALINAHQAEFLRLVNEPAGPEDAGAAAAALAAMQGAGGAGGGLPPGAVQIQLTPEEGEALARLEALGFDRHAALEAYLACDKDEALAANYLFENPPGDDDDDGGGEAGA